MLIDHIASRSETPDADKPTGTGVSRRNFLKVGAAAGGGMLLSVSLPSLMGEAEAATAAPFAPDAFIRIAPTGVVTIVCNQVEMGQGTYTSMPMLIAEELEVEFDKVKWEHAPADDKLYALPLFGFQVTGGSTSVRAYWEPMRKTGAVARTMLIAAAAETWKVDPSTCHAEKGEVIHTPTGHKLSYGKLVDKAAKQPVPTDVKLKDPKDFKLIGKPAHRLDTSGKVNGTAQYGLDVKIPGMKIATVAASPTRGGKLISVDDTQAKAVKGVRQILKLDDAVAVVADHMGAAKKGLAALNITWDLGPNAKFSTADYVKQMAGAIDGEAAVGAKVGDAPAAIAKAPKKFEAIYEAPFLAHATMEPMNCTVHIRKDSAEIWTGTQVMTRAKAAVVQITGLPPEKVQVYNHLLGGGFGRRLDIDGVIQAVSFAKQVDYPVKFVWTREEDIQHDYYRPYYYDRLTAGLDDKGMPVGFHHRTVGSSIVARWIPPLFKGGLDFDAVEAGAGPYTFPNTLVDYVRSEPPAGITTAWWRGVGVTHNAFMVEGFVDELAVEAGQDPVEYRRALLAKDKRAAAVMDLAAQKAGWGSKMPAGKGRGISVILGFGTYVAMVAEVTVAKDGKVRVDRIVAAIDCGYQVNPDTIKAQAEGGAIFGVTMALYGEITFKDGQVEQTNFDTYQMVRIDEAPKVEVYLIDSTEAPGGMGEPGTSAIAPAVVNAVFAATGKRLRKLPINMAELKSA